MKLYRCLTCDNQLVRFSEPRHYIRHKGHKIQMAKSCSLIEMVRIVWWKILVKIKG